MADLPFWDNKASLFISNYIKHDILQTVLTNGVLYIHAADKNKNIWKDIDDIVRAAAVFLNVDVFYTDGTYVSVPGCGEICLGFSYS
jgi:hypothetical protein